MYTLEPLPETREESSVMPTEPGTTHGECAHRLVICHTKGFSSSTATGFWRWCATCGVWKKAVGILPAMCCPTCNKMWS